MGRVRLAGVARAEITIVRNRYPAFAIDAPLPPMIPGHLAVISVQ